MPSGSIIENYPKTAEWYAKTRETLKEIAERESDPVKQNERKIFVSVIIAAATWI